MTPGMMGSTPGGFMTPGMTPGNLMGQTPVSGGGTTEKSANI